MDARALHVLRTTVEESTKKWLFQSFEDQSTSPLRCSVLVLKTGGVSVEEVKGFLYSVETLAKQSEGHKFEAWWDSIECTSLDNVAVVIGASSVTSSVFESELRRVVPSIHLIPHMDLIVSHSTSSRGYIPLSEYLFKNLKLLTTWIKSHAAMPRFKHSVTFEYQSDGKDTHRIALMVKGGGGGSDSLLKRVQGYPSFKIVEKQKKGKKGAVVGGAAQPPMAPLAPIKPRPAAASAVSDDEEDKKNSSPAKAARERKKNHSLSVVQQQQIPLPTTEFFEVSAPLEQKQQQQQQPPSLLKPEEKTILILNDPDLLFPDESNPLVAEDLQTLEQVQAVHVNVVSILDKCAELHIPVVSCRLHPITSSAVRKHAASKAKSPYELVRCNVEVPQALRLSDHMHKLLATQELEHVETSSVSSMDVFRSSFVPLLHSRYPGRKNLVFVGATLSLGILPKMLAAMAAGFSARVVDDACLDLELDSGAAAAAVGQSLKHSCLHVLSHIATERLSTAQFAQNFAPKTFAAPESAAAANDAMKSLADLGVPDSGAVAHVAIDIDIPLEAITADTTVKPLESEATETVTAAKETVDTSAVASFEELVGSFAEGEV